MTKNHRFTMDENIIFDEGQSINPFECMKLLNHFYDKNIDLMERNKQLEQRIKTLEDTIEGLTGTMAHFMEDTV